MREPNVLFVHEWIRKKKASKERGPGSHQGLSMTARAMPGIRPDRILVDLASPLVREGDFARSATPELQPCITARPRREA
jgi:hypothetical protein